MRDLPVSVFMENDVYFKGFGLKNRILRAVLAGACICSLLAAPGSALPGSAEELPSETAVYTAAAASLEGLLQDRTVMGTVYLAEHVDALTEPGTGEVIASLPSGSQVFLEGMKMQGSTPWYLVSFYVEDVLTQGYLPAAHVVVTDSEFLAWERTALHPYVAAGSMEKVLLEGSNEDIETFPSSYRKYLRTLRAAHPNWVFVPMNTGLDWTEVVREECSNNRSWIYYTYPDAWKAEPASQAKWYIASEAAVKYVLDPRNFINDKYLFMFEQLTYNAEYHSRDGVQNILNGSFMEGAIPDEVSGITYADAFTEIGSALGTSPYHLACRVYQEQGKDGLSPIISGTVEGYEGYYNYFNVGATGKTSTDVILAGLSYAKGAGWDTRYKSLLGGAQVISSGYILRGQDTLYLQKFDVDSSSLGLYRHQYMQNITAPMTESTGVRTAYEQSNSIDNPYVFKIPVYYYMPVNAVPAPGEEDTGLNLSEEQIRLVRDFIDRLYRVALVRTEVRGDEIDYWYNRVADGTDNGSAVAYGFFFSDEYKNKKTTDEEYVDTLYRVMFNREADAGGRKNWLDLLKKGMSRYYIFCGFAGSEEWFNTCDTFGIDPGEMKLTDFRDQNVGVTSFVYRLYDKILGRAGEDDGIEDWCGRILRKKCTPVEAAQMFVHSEEFANKKTTDQEYITVLYRAFLDREPDASGFAYWLGKLQSGEATRDSLLDGFAYSEEFSNLMKKYGFE
jgi:beta-N-acetylglucosaminidase